MGALYSVCVERLAGAVVELRVTTIHPDAGPPPAAATFAMTLVVEVWKKLADDMASLIEGVTIASPEALAASEPWGPVMSALVPLLYGREQAISHAVYRKLKPGKQLDGKQVKGWGSRTEKDKTTYHVNLAGDFAAFTAAIAPLVKSVEHDEKKHEGSYTKWSDARNPTRRITLALTDGAVLGFLREGMTFQTAAYR